MTPWHNNILDCFVTVDRNDIRDVKSLCHYFQRFSVQMEVENQDLANLGPPIKLELELNRPRLSSLLLWRIPLSGNQDLNCHNDTEHI